MASDLEMTKLCAEAMGLCINDSGTVLIGHSFHAIYAPLTDDSQAFAMIRLFGLAVWGSDRSAGSWKWHAEVQHWADGEKNPIGHGDTPNRAIVECVAQMQAKGGPDERTE